MENVLEPSALGLAARISDPPPKLGTPNVPEVSAKTNSGTGEPDEDWLIRREILASAGRLRNALRVVLKKASNLRAEDCSVMTDLDVSSAAMEMEYTAPLKSPKIIRAMITSKSVNPARLVMGALFMGGKPESRPFPLFRHDQAPP